MENFDLWKWIGDTVEGVRKKFRGEDEIISPLPQNPTPTPDPWVEKGFTKAGGGYYKTGEDSKTYVDKNKIPPEVVSQVDADYDARRGRKATPTPTAAPKNQMLDEFSPSQYRVSGNYEIPTPPDAIAEQIKETFGKEAGRAVIVAGTENGRYDPNATNQNSGDNGVDIGIFQINSNTLDDFMRRKPKQVAAIGVDDFEDLRDPIKNIKMAKIIMDEQGWNAWYGPRDRGYNVYD